MPHTNDIVLRISEGSHGKNANIAIIVEGSDDSDVNPKEFEIETCWNAEDESEAIELRGCYQG